MLAALAHRQHDDDSVAWAGAYVDATLAVGAAVPYVMEFQGSTCFMVTRTDINILPTNLDTPQVGRGEEASSAGGSVFRFLPINDKNAGRAAMTPFEIPASTDQEAVLFRDVHAAMCAEAEIVVVSEILRRTTMFTPEYLDAIPALPYTTTDKLFVMDLQPLQGKKYGGVSALNLCAGVLTINALRRGGRGTPQAREDFRAQPSAQRASKESAPTTSCTLSRTSTRVCDR